MIKANNSYLIFDIPCDEYGKPLGKVTNGEIYRKYLQKLFQIYLKYDELALIEEEKRIKMNQLRAKGIRNEEKINKIIEAYKRSEEMKTKRQKLREKDNKFLSQVCINKSIKEAIGLLEGLINNHQFLHENNNFKEVFDFYQIAFNSINSKEKRKQYDEKLEEERNIEFMKFAEKNKANLRQKEVVDENILYLGIHRDLSLPKNSYDLLYKNDDCILLINDRFFVTEAIQKERLSDIKSSAVLKRKELIEYALLLKQDKAWRNYTFISGKQSETIFKSDRKETKKDEYFRILVTALKNKILKERPMIGSFRSKGEGQFEELDDMKLFEKVAEYNNQKNNIKGELDKWAR